MHPSYTFFPLLLLPVVTVNPDTVPAKWKQESIISIEKPGMYRITAESQVGTACEIVDHLRGPFGWSGEEGKSSCKLDLLLDAGVYKLRMRSPKKGEGTVKIEAKPFEEINQDIVRLEEGRFVEQELHPGQQASYWIRVEKRRYVLLRAMGRTAGEVRLWRDGEWVEEVEARKSEYTPMNGQPIFDWELGGSLEAGDYLLVIYSASPKSWTKGKEEDFLLVANGFPQGSEDRAIAFNLPRWGKVAYQVPKGKLVGFVSLDQAVSDETTLRLQTLPDDEGDRLGGFSGSGRIAPKAPIPLCSAWSSNDSRHLITVSGPPGASGMLKWGSYTGDYYLLDDGYTNVRDTLSFGGPADDRFLVAVHDVPADTDAAPLSCELESLGDVRHHLTVRDFLKLGKGRSFRRAFNYNGREETIWFEVTDGGIYKVATSGELKNRCVLYLLEETKRSIVGDTDPGAKDCQIARHFPPGAYELKIYGGNEGIEKLTLAFAKDTPSSSDKKTRNSDKNSCLIPEVHLEDRGRYSLKLNRSGAVTLRGLVLRRLPLKLERPLPLVVDAFEKVQLEVGGGGDLLVRSAGGGKFSCAWKGAPAAEAREGSCRLPPVTTTTTLQIDNPTEATLVLSLNRPTPKETLPRLSIHSPQPRVLPKLSLDDPKFFEFEREQSHSMVFDVKEAGLYHMTTQGLLQTDCRLRTAITSRLNPDVGVGRGRNCLLSNFLRPGRYLLTVKTIGLSRGRAAVLVSRRPVRQVKGINAEGETFFTAGADELIRQELAIKKNGNYLLRTTGPGIYLQCRLDDQEGWPLVRLPTSCVQTQQLEAGTYRWTQLPLTVESMRRTELSRVRKPRVLRGERRHGIELNTWYTAELSNDGKDEFTFRLPADLEVSITLDHGMQGRLYRMTGKSKTEPIDSIPPDAGAVTKHLARDRYLLVTEHSRADVGISYRLHLGSDTLAPGLTRDLYLPSSANLRMPEDGVLRLKTTGESDTRCRLFDREGKLVAESSSHGADWNCLIATPLTKGDYRLVLEAENTLPGNTKVSVFSTRTQDVGILEGSKLYQPTGKVFLAGVPGPLNGQIQELDFRSKLTFSCALEEEGRGAIHQEEDTRRCLLLINPKGKRYRILLWSKNWYARISARVANRPIQVLDGNLIPEGKAALVTVPRPGRYRTAREAWCLPDAEGGLMLPCGPEASLEPGAVIFSTTGPKNMPLELMEQIVSLNRNQEEPLRLNQRFNIQRQQSDRASLHLLTVKLPAGEPVSPACRIDGGIHHIDDQVCFAASAPTKESLARCWVPSKTPFSASVTRAVAPVPEKAIPLRVGVSRLVWQGSVVRLLIPKEPCRVELTLPHGAWAVQTDASGATVDLCTPAGNLSHCTLGGRGGELFIVSDAEPHAGLRVVLEQKPPEREVLRTLYERIPEGQGCVQLKVPAASETRRLLVSGAKRCVVNLEDGDRLSGCQCILPAGKSAELILFHDKKPLRTVAYTEGKENAASWGQTTSAPSSPLQPATALALDGQFKNAALVLESTAVIRLHSDSGVCALASAKGLDLVEGMGSGCDSYRLLNPGGYRFMVRSFAGRPLTGSLVWTVEPLETLNEGIGPQYWLSPGEAAIFQFTTRSAGEIGLGLQVDADRLACNITDRQHLVLGRGCQQFIHLEQGSYLLHVRAPEEGDPIRFKPVIVGLSGSKMEVPEEYLRDFFQRIGERP